MGYLVESLEGQGLMEKKQCSSSNNTTSSSKTPKLERRTVEKNRRNQMKNLYSELNSLLPGDQSFKEAMSLPDQIDEAINYIKNLEIKLKECKEKKERLSRRKRSYACTSNYTEDMSSSKSPQIQIHEMGSNLEVILTSGVNNQFIFYEAIRILHEDGADVVNAIFSAVGNSILHVIRAEIRDTMLASGAAKITERLNRLVGGSSSEEELQSPELWDFEIDPDCWEALN